MNICSVFPPSLLLIIAHAWLICCNVQQFQMLKLLTWICFIAATMSLLLILRKEDLDKILFFSNEGWSDTHSGLTWKLQTIAEEYLDLISTSFFCFRESAAYNEYKKALVLTTSQYFTVLSVAVLLGSCKYVMFCLAQQLLMPSIPKAPPPGVIYEILSHLRRAFQLPVIARKWQDPIL